MQYVGGTYYKQSSTQTGWSQCVIGKFTSRGDYQAAYYLSTTSSQLTSECYNLAIIPDLYNVVMVGKAYGPIDNNVPIDYKTSALIILVDQNLNKLAMKIWSFSGDYWDSNQAITQQARDVAVSPSDGSIYITGVVSGGFTFTGSQNCFILRVDASLNKINIRSFGLPGSTLTCNFIQVTRNADYLYVGGTLQQTRSSLFFAKLDALANQLVATSLQSTLVNFGLRRIILETQKSYQAANDNNNLYFCGFTSGNNGDMIYGNLQSNGLTSLSLKLIFQYGSPNSEFTFTSSSQIPYSYGDCALTEDNAYLLLVFSTNYQTPRIGGMSKYSFSYSTPTTGNEAFYDPNVPGLTPGCNDLTMADLQNDFLYYSQTPASTGTTFNGTSLIAAYCESTLKSQLNTYVTNYNNANTYAWRACGYYIYQYYQATCNVAELQFASCNTNTGNSIHQNGYLELWSNGLSNSCGGSCPSCYGWGCGAGTCSACTTGSCITHNDCCQNCNPYLSLYNTQIWWYPSGATCGNWQFRMQAYNPQLGPQNIYDPYLFCQTSAASCVGSDGISYNEDQINFVFEQDCADDGSGYQSLYIFRVNLGSASYAVTNIANMPDAAAYFGDQYGRTYGHTIAVDEYGFIYVHGISDSKAFGGVVGSRSSWIRVKTHWEMTYELQFDQTLTNTYYSMPTPSFMGKRFVRPKRFQGATFGSVLYNSGAAIPGTLSITSPAVVSFPANENTYDLLTGTNAFYDQHSYIAANWISVNRIWGYSFARLNPIQTIHLNKSSTTYNHSFSLPTVCITYEADFDLNGVSLKQSQWNTKYFTYTLPYDFANSQTLSLTVTGVNATVYPTVTPEMYHLSGIINSALLTEGSYYMMFRSSTQYYVNPKSSIYKCDLPDYGYFFNDMMSESLRRYESSIRIKIVLDDVSVQPPMNLMNIEDIFPVGGQRYELNIGSMSAASVFTSQYFANCNMLKVRSSLYTVNTIQTNQLPYWVQFFESNSTFVIYPNAPLTTVHIEVSCCNIISQCIRNTFSIIPQNALPGSTITFFDENYILQLDGTIGQSFEWAKTVQYFWDPNQDPSNPANPQYDPNDLPYHNCDQIVELDFTPAIPSGFNKVLWVGMVFGQAFTTNYLSTLQTLPFQYYDLFTISAPQLGSLSILMNKMPQITPAGSSYVFATVDPSANQPLTFFNQYFPFLASQTTPLTQIQTSTWFTSTQTLWYAMNRSDGTEAPDWLLFQQNTGQLTVDARISDASELVNIVIQAMDQNQGVCQTYKSVLVNCQPQTLILYSVLELALGRQYSFNISTLITDVDGDKLIFSIPSTADQTTLNWYGLSFLDATKNIVGTPSEIGEIGLITVIATDPHGAYATTYLSLIINNYQVSVRKIGSTNGNYQSQTLYEHRRYIIPLPDNLTYDSFSGQPLILFASDSSDEQLPVWIHFDPKSRTLYGVAPQAGISQDVRIRAMNQFSHDSYAVDFTISVVVAPLPMINLQLLSDDLIVDQHSWFSYTVPINALGNLVFNYQPTFAMFGGSNLTVPSFIKFNPDNRTIYGVTQNQTGSFRIDIVFTDDIGNQAFLNLKLTILPKDLINARTLYINIAASSSLIAGLLVYFSYLFHWHYLSMTSKRLKAYRTSLKKRAKQRFGRYQDIQVQFVTEPTIKEAYVDQGNSQAKLIREDFDETQRNDDYEGKQTQIWQGQQKLNGDDQLMEAD